jgi:phosphate-selective porin OprO and OprP
LDRKNLIQIGLLITIFSLFINQSGSAQFQVFQDVIDIEDADMWSLLNRGLLPGETPYKASESDGYRDPEVIQTENFSMNLGTRFQLRYTYTDPDEGPEVGSFSVRRARFSVYGDAYRHFNYALQLEMAGSAVQLIDANIRYRVASMATLWAGQGKAYFGRQQLVSSGNLNFVDRSEADTRFSAKRQAGIALIGQNESQTFEYNLGIYNGNGINTANDNGKYMKTARVVLTPFGAYPLTESAHDYPESPKLAIGVAGLHTTEGVSSDETGITRLNIESAFMIKGFNFMGEFYLENAEPVNMSSYQTIGWYTQAGFLLPGRRNEIVFRYAVIDSEENFTSDLVETGVAFSHYFYGHRAKLQADLRNINWVNLDSHTLEFRIQLQVSI